MTQLIITVFLSFISSIVVGQSIDKPFPQRHMRKDLQIFKAIRQEANSGLYKYRTEQQIDSLYNWAEREIEQLSTYRDFYNLISTLTDYEGSLHNDTSMPDKKWQELREEEYGYFPYPIKWIEGKWLVNLKHGDLPLGAEIVSINDKPILKIMLNLYKYYTTDGDNVTGKRIGIRTHFARYYRLHYGRTDRFSITYKRNGFDAVEHIDVQSVSSSTYYKHFNTRHSKLYDQIYYADLSGDELYNYKEIDAHTGLLTIYSFSMGNENSSEHKKYVAFLDRVFTEIKTKDIQNLIVDIRYNGGGTDPNDLVTYSYLTGRTFQENKSAYISFNKIPLLTYYNTKVPRFIRPLGVRKFNKDFQKVFPENTNKGYFQDDRSDDHTIRTPHNNAFAGNVYLLISPAVASAGSLFAAMVAGNENTVTIGEETMGGYYGHNGHTPLEYKLPKSKIITRFSVVNLDQDVPNKLNQIKGRGVIPDHEIPQTYVDFMKNEDTQLQVTVDLIRGKKKSISFKTE